MDKGPVDRWNNVLKLFRFMFWYAVVVAAILYLLPWAGRELESHYDALSSSARLLSLVGFLVAVAVWQVLNLRKRVNQARRGARKEAADDPPPPVG